MKVFKVFLVLSSLLFEVWMANTHLPSNLKAVAVVFRHGDRAPMSTYPLDPYKDYPWPAGLGGLTLIGEQHMYEAGLVKAQRYSSLLFNHKFQNGSHTFNTNQIHVQSSSAQRCVSSAEYFLDGFLPIKGPNNMIYVASEKDDKILSFPGRPCPKYQSSMFTAFPLNVSGSTQIIEQIKNCTGLKQLGPELLVMLADTLNVQNDNGLPLPAWADSIYKQFILPVMPLAMDIFSKSPLLSIRSGALLKDMVDRLQNVLLGKSMQNILLYSGHDATIVGLLHRLGIRDQFQSLPAYSSSISLELYEIPGSSNDVQVKMFYSKDHKDSDPINFKIPNCPDPCYFQTFIESVKLKLTIDYDQTCAI